MKNYFIFIFFLTVVVLPASASAAFTCSVKSSCNSVEVNVLELSGTTNAHAASPGSGYPYAVCCSGVSGLATSCSGGQVFAKLSGAQNAHIRLNTESDYPGSNNACLSVSAGTLTLGNQDNNCNGFDTIILSLAKIPTNSHAGDGSVYPHKICAKYKPPPSGGWVSRFFGGSGGWLSKLFFGDGSQDAPKTEFAADTVAPAPTSADSIPDVAISSIPEAQPSGGNASAPDDGGVLPADQADAGEQNLEDFSPASGDVQLAGASQSKSRSSSLLTSTLFKIISILAVLVLIIVGRKLYLGRK